MKNTIRVRKNRSASRTTPQAKTSRRKPTAKPVSPSAAEMLTVIFYSNDNDNERARFEMPADVFDRIAEFNIKNLLPLNHFFFQAIRDKLVSAERPHKAFDWEPAALKAICLIELLLSKAIEDAGDEMYPSLPGFNFEKTKFICGLQNLSNNVTRDLLAGLHSPSTIGTEVAS